MPSNEKLLIGPRIARFRKTLGLTQSRMAEDLGISTSYLNLMERNQRSLSAKFYFVWLKFMILILLVLLELEMHT